ncbi:hypothetical protein N798_07595 [Knoellia flava TL1]|uniref:Uncharacterized protein n=1 Tax=Knoellia flava TL1 TaxID=1385518 RepID=A0ABR4XEH2_9MICO|nr:hypothetical protein N798_07595 [Knoellia flava TL1]
MVLGWSEVGSQCATAARAEVSRVRASAATSARASLPVTETMASGSIASTTVVASSTERTTTLHGRRTPIEGSAPSAARARGGRQAPRITCGGRSASSFALRVAARSISVRMPNPWSASADRVDSSTSGNGRSTVVPMAWVTASSLVAVGRKVRRTSGLR